ncbi:hypothetical protein SBRY_100221 [Actinacidiphila bryophytorum]|uniref:Uncharacterized protein n=1 Tax=Actinacidiphila bryophytorum TaxID=1436133 RepID=A0A9W4E585_9ACTN|nr:hypothetical protein [Actinacidiphila bryophytorum]CAG7613976.1 hypothetical protein SBRY_100221 [Actinacidiphila bryophytorum]
MPEGLLPTITLALATGVRELARRGAVVKRLSAVETLGATTVVCTDKTGTLTENRMRAVTVWTPEGERPADAPGPAPQGVRLLVDAAADCTTAGLRGRHGDPTELALLDLAAASTGAEPETRRDTERRALFRFDPRIKLMTVASQRDGALLLHTKGAPEEVLARADTILDAPGQERPLGPADRTAVMHAIGRLADRGLRVLANRGRCQRRPRAAALRHRRGHGPLRHRRRPRVRHHGAHRRRLRDHRVRGRGRPAHL